MSVIGNLAALYAKEKVNERGEYPGFNIRIRKTLTRFDGFDIEQAYEEGADAVMDKILSFMAEDNRISYEHIRTLIRELRE